MKKIMMMLIAVVAAFQTISADDVVTQDASQLPAQAREMITKYFPQSQISYIKIDKDLFEAPTYEVMLTNGTEIDFNGSGQWVEIDCKQETVPTYFYIAPLADYLRNNYASERVVKIERDRKGYEVTLSNGLEVKFDRDGKFLKLDR